MTDLERAILKVWDRGGGGRRFAYVARLLRTDVSTVVEVLHRHGRGRGRRRASSDTGRRGRTAAKRPRGATRALVLKLLADGLTVDEVAAAAGIHRVCVRYHIRQLGPLVEALDMLRDDTAA